MLFESVLKVFYRGSVKYWHVKPIWTPLVLVSTKRKTK